MNWRALAHIALPVAAMLGGTGCYKASFVNPGVTAGVEKDQWTDFFIYGIVGHEKIDVKKFCPGEVAKVATGANVGTVIVTALTAGLYAPHKVYVTCAASAGQASAERELVIALDAAGRPVEVAGRIGERYFHAVPQELERAGEFRVATNTEEGAQ